MLQLALQDDDALQALTLSSRQFTIQDTLPELQARFPGERLVFLLGSDVVDTFRHRWPGLARLFAEVELAIGLREGSDKRSVDALFAELATTFGRARYRCLTSPRPGAASSRIRGATEPHAAEGLPEEVTEYMRRHRLYI
jgi:nicotinic acid mononucleotide adenylyltransferase